MSKLDYGTMLSQTPIYLRIGTLRKPTLRDIAEIGFDRFGYYEFILKINPESFYNSMKGDEGIKYWKSLKEEERNALATYDVILKERVLREAFLEVFNFFFVQDVVFESGYFVVLKNEGHKLNDDSDEGLTLNQVYGAIASENFEQVLEIIQQICCIYEQEEEDDSMFKNALAKKLYEKIQKAKKQKKNEKKSDINLFLPNIISSVSNKHPTISPLTVWDLTIFQLIDAFNRTQANQMYEIDSTRVSVWGDEKKTFDPALWYKNDYDKK